MARAIKKTGGWILGSLPMRLLRVATTVRLSRGYHRFYYTALGVLPADSYTLRKTRLLLPCLHEHASGTTVLDLGSANGYYSLLAGLAGAADVLGVERNERLRRDAHRAARQMGLSQVSFQRASIYHLDTSFRRDLVLALAIVHWFKHPDRPKFLQYEGVVRYLSGLASRCLIVEHISPEDPTFIQTPGLPQDGVSAETDFSRQALVASLEREFQSVRYLGDTRLTRSLYLAVR